MTHVEQIMRRWRFAKSEDLKNRSASVKRLVGGLRNQLREGELGQFLTSDQVADLRSATAALERIADHIKIASTMLKKREEERAEIYRQEELMKRQEAGLQFFADAAVDEMASLAMDLSSYLFARKRFRSGSIEHAAKRFQERVGDVERTALLRAVGEEVCGFGDVRSPHFFHSNNDLTLTDFQVFRVALIEQRQVEDLAKNSPNVVLLKKSGRK